MSSYHPIVFWGQSKEYILLSIKVVNAMNECINIFDESITFNAKGEGSNGLKVYDFDIKFYLPVIPKDSSWKVKENFIEIKLKKEYKEPWARLTLSNDKLPWLKCDFNNFFFDDSDSGSDNSHSPLKALVNDKSSSDIYELTNDSDEYFREIMKPLNLYLLIYNLFQFAGYFYVFGVCIWIAFNNGLHESIILFPLIRDQLITVQLASILEILHAYLGWVKSSPKATLMQVFGRNVVLFLIILPHRELQSDQELLLLLFSWSCIEVVRYPYYLLIMLHENIAFITWLRYSIWIPLYPIGFMSEGKLILKSIKYLQQSNRFSIYLPNIWNVQFDFVLFLYIYIPFTILGFYNLMMRMYCQRKSKIGPSLKSTWSNYSFLQFLIETLKPNKTSHKVVEKKLSLHDQAKPEIDDSKSRKQND